VVGAKAFIVNGCLACHGYLGDGATRLAALDLTAEGTRHRGVEWQLKLLRCPTCVLAGIPMPPLPFIHARDVAVFLEASKGAALRKP
jgi:cbb3-type cytochrome oxidase cytochrome c subunit